MIYVSVVIHHDLLICSISFLQVSIRPINGSTFWIHLNDWIWRHRPRRHRRCRLSQKYRLITFKLDVPSPSSSSSLICCRRLRRHDQGGIEFFSSTISSSVFHFVARWYVDLIPYSIHMNPLGRLYRCHFKFQSQDSGWYYSSDDIIIIVVITNYHVHGQATNVCSSGSRWMSCLRSIWPDNKQLSRIGLLLFYVQSASWLGRVLLNWW